VGHLDACRLLALRSCQCGYGGHISSLTVSYRTLWLGKVTVICGGGFNGINNMNVYVYYLIENSNETKIKTKKIIDTAIATRP